MPNILVVTGSARPNSVNEKIVPLVVAELEAQHAQAVIVDLKTLNLPFFDSPLPPTAPDYVPSNEAVQEWTDLVDGADGVVLITPEYNHTMTPIQLNAVDWIGKEWAAKPVALVGYGWGTGGAQAHDTAREALGVNLKAIVGQTPTTLFFMKDITPDGNVQDDASVSAQLTATVTELLSLNDALAAPANELVSAA